METPNYKSAKEFADLFRKELYEYMGEPEDLEARIQAVEEHYKKEIEDSGFNVKRNFGPTVTMYEEVVESIVLEFYKILPNSIKEKFERHFHFSTIDTKVINASVKRSNIDNFFAVLINSSLISLLTKVGKLNMASGNPSCVLFCNRFPTSKPSKSDIDLMRNELYEYYQKYKLAYGPYLIIGGNEKLAHFHQLRIQEKFIIFHEIGHFLNGDLFDNKNSQPLVEPFTNIDHQREHYADLIAFAILLRTESKISELTREKRMSFLYALIELFLIFNGIQNDATETHPHLLNRMSVIIDYYFGSTFSDMIEDAIKLNKGFEHLGPMAFPEIKSQEEIMNIILDKSLNNAFNFL